MRWLKESKYHNKKVTVDGITFDSQREAARWQELRLMERAGKTVYEDSKGMKTKEYLLKRKLLYWRHGIEITET